MRERFLDVRLVTQEWFLERLPEPFDGFRILQISDLHCDLDTTLTPVVVDISSRAPHDLAVITGDFRNAMDGSHTRCVEETRRIIAGLARQRCAILGNHDFIEMVPELEQAGLPFLLNETLEIKKDDASLWIAGIDDPHYYKTHDLAGVRSHIPAHACSVLLSHSPETFEEAESLGFDLLLSGHTHGGQICLPGGIPIIVPCKIRRPLIAGRWIHGHLQGYTSRGTGACGVAARWHCSPEITLHILRKGK
jgi:predicted MPP superfamily phosphohydrolase